MYPLGAGLPKLAFEALDVSNELLHFLDCRFLNVLGPTAPGPTYPVTTALVILLKATAHVQDLNAVVRETDTFDWDAKELRSKLDYTIRKLKSKVESHRIFDSKDPAAVDACLLRKLNSSYVSMPAPKKRMAAAAAATAAAAAAAALSSTISGGSAFDEPSDLLPHQHTRLRAAETPDTQAGAAASRAIEVFSPSLPPLPPPPPSKHLRNMPLIPFLCPYSFPSRLAEAATLPPARSPKITMSPTCSASVPWPRPP